MAELRERLLHPREGWLSFTLLAVMVLALSWSIQGAAWLDKLAFVPPVALYALLAGAILAILPFSVVINLPVGALLGTLVVVWAVGGEHFPTLGQIERLMLLREELLGWVVEVVRVGYPHQLTPYGLALGALIWTTAFIAGYTVYRHHRVLDAILLVGVALVANMSATFANLFAYLVIFVCAAILLWLRTTLMTRQEGWQRRRVNENVEVPTSILRSGLVFGGGSIVLAWVLTSVAVAAPLTDAWRNLDGVWTGLQDRVEGVFGTLTNPEARLGGTSFGSSFVVRGEWVSSDEPALVVSASRPVYLRAVTLDRYTGRGWARSEGLPRQIEPGGRIFPDPTAERPEVEEAFAVETIAIVMEQALGRNLFTAGYPILIFTPAVIHEPAGVPALGGLESANAFGAGDGYQVTVALSEATEAQLSAAPTTYPGEITQLYLDASGVTDRTRTLARDVTVGAADTYQRAKALARFLSRDASFTYSTVAAVPPADADLVDFFLFDEQGREGYCEYFASAMVMMARSIGIPARMAVGFAPGADQEDGTYLVREANAHAWAELYFPGYGWQIFEATKTIDAQFVRPRGVTGPLPTLPPGVGTGIEDSEREFDPRRNVVHPLPTGAVIEGGFDASQRDAPDEPTRGGNAIVILVLLAGVGAFIFLRMRGIGRRWRFLPAGERTWQQLALAADRAGVAQRPSETIYEYSGWLEEQIPTRRPEIRTIADGKVWQSYSGRRMNHSAVSRLEAAWRRLRRPLLWLTVRHWVRGLIRRR